MQAKTFLYSSLISFSIFASTGSASGQQVSPARTREDDYTAGTRDSSIKQPEVLKAEAPTEDRRGISSAAIASRRKTERPDFNRDIYYKNKLEKSFETGWLPYNIPFILDFLVGSRFDSWPLPYTLVPNMAFVRWQLVDICGWKMFRGNTDFSFSGSYT